MSRKDISRRSFLGLAGGAVGAAVMASMGYTAGETENKLQIDLGDLTEKEIKTDVLVVGGGMAGLFAAVKAHDAGAKVAMVVKGGLGTSGQTPFAKGIFAFDPKTSDISLDEFVDKVSYSALGTNNPVYTRQMAEHSLARVKDLREWGFFDAALCRTSFEKPVKERGIPVIERVTITHLIKEKGKIVGAAGFSIDEQKLYFINAKSVILCTGAGGFKPNGFPICDLTHDGTIMAYDIGAKVTGKEWNDGHPGRSENAAACFDGWHGMFEKTPSVTGVGIRHDLGVDMNYQAYQNGGAARMGRPGGKDTTAFFGGPYRPSGLEDKRREGGDRPGGEGRPPEGGRPQGNEGRRPPGDKRRGKERGGPPGMGGSVVGGSSAGMSIHKSEGLVPVNDKCESNIPGLYAAGDALGSYMAGAIYTQIGSSLAGSAVQGAIAGEAAAEYISSVKLNPISKNEYNRIKQEILGPLQRESGYSPAWITQTLQGIMIPNFVLYIKSEKMLQAALAYVEELRDHHLPMIKASDMHELRLAHETRNMVISAEMKLKASIMRTESRCSHYRLDYPELDNENWQAWINIYKGMDGDMQFEKQEFKSFGS